MALNANALTTVAKAKSHLAVTPADVSQDARIELFVNAASERVARYCDRNFVAQSYTEYHSSNGTDFLIPKDYPVNSIAEIRVSSSQDWSVTPTPAADYFIEDNSDTISFAYQLPRGRQNIRLMYNAGYTAIPSDLELACLWFVEFFYRHRERGDMGRTSLGKGDESVGVLAEMPKMILQILNDYKRTEMPYAPVAVRAF